MCLGCNEVGIGHAGKPSTVIGRHFAAYPRANLAVVTLVLLFVLFLLALWFAPIPLAKVDAFIPIVVTVMFLTDSITATLLFAQFSMLRSRALLVLANGYLFTALT